MVGPDKTLKQMQRRFNYVLERVGLTRKALGMTGKGMQHEAGLVVDVVRQSVVHQRPLLASRTLYDPDPAHQERQVVQSIDHTSDFVERASHPVVGDQAHGAAQAETRVGMRHHGACELVAHAAVEKHADGFQRFTGGVHQDHQGDGPCHGGLDAGFAQRAPEAT